MRGRGNKDARSSQATAGAVAFFVRTLRLDQALKAARDVVFIILPAFAGTVVEPSNAGFGRRVCREGAV